MTQTRNYTRRKDIQPEQILSAYFNNRKTFLCLESGETITSSIPFHELITLLPEEEFVTVRRGAVLRKDAIISISDEAVYTTKDGNTYQGAKRSITPHKRLRKELNIPSSPDKYFANRLSSKLPLSLIDKCSLVDNMPIAFCIIELVFDGSGHGIDFIFRYCNKYMEIIEGKTIEEMVDHSFYEVFKEGDRKWLIAYADVALNGVTRTLHDYSPEIDKTLTIRCYQPEEGFCACVLEVDETN